MITLSSITRIAFISAIVLGGCAVTHIDIPYTEEQRHRTVVETQSQRPVPGAIVLFLWDRRESTPPAGGITFCDHMELARSNDQGRYTVPTWRGRSPMIVAIYKRGLSRDYVRESDQRGVDVMNPFTGTTTERYTELGRILNSMGCDERELRNAKELLEAMNDEGIAIARTETDAKASESLQTALERVLYGGDEARRRHTERAVDRSNRGSAK